MQKIVCLETRLTCLLEYHTPITHTHTHTHTHTVTHNVFQFPCTLDFLRQGQNPCVHWWPHTSMHPVHACTLQSGRFSDTRRLPTGTVRARCYCAHKHRIDLINLNWRFFHRGNCLGCFDGRYAPGSPLETIMTQLCYVCDSGSLGSQIAFSSHCMRCWKCKLYENHASLCLLLFGFC